MASYTSSNYSTTTSSDSTPWYDQFIPWADHPTSGSTTDSYTSENPLGSIINVLSRLDDNRLDDNRGVEVTDSEVQSSYNHAKRIKRMNNLDSLHSELRNITLQPNSPATPVIEKIRYIVKNKFFNCGHECGHLCETRFAHHLVKSIRKDWSKETLLGSVIAVFSSIIYALGKSKAMDEPVTVLFGGGIGLGAVILLRIGFAAARAFSDNP